MAAVEEPKYDITISYVSFAAVPMSLAMSQEVDKTPVTCIPCQPLQAKRHFCHKLKPESSLPTKGQDSPIVRESLWGQKPESHSIRLEFCNAFGVPTEMLRFCQMLKN